MHSWLIRECVYLVKIKCEQIMYKFKKCKLNITINILIIYVIMKKMEETMKKILITGSKGQLGKALLDYYKDVSEVEVIATDVDELDISDECAVSKMVATYKPDYIINCAAFTNVEKCETEYDTAYLINAVGVKNIALAAKDNNAVLVHISTDYVFDGNKQGAYIEEDIPVSNSAYGKSKLAGEVFVKEILERYFIVRTAWLFGEGNNFINTMIGLSKNNDTVQVVADQIGSPTSAEEVAKVIAMLINSDKYGLYHATCEGKCSWAQFAKKIFDLLYIDTKVKSVTSKEYPSKVNRPKNSVLENKKLAENFNYRMCTWQEAVENYLVNKNQQKKILVTGANGYVGSHVVQEALDLGYEVLAADFTFDCVDPRASRITTPIFSGNENIYQELGSPDICIHLAWRNGFIHNDDSHLLDLANHYIFIKNMIAGGVKSLAIMGTMHEVGYWEGPIDEFTPTNPTSLYGIAKNALKQTVFSMISNYDVSVKWLRAFYIMGDDAKNNSIFSKILKAEEDGQEEFPLNSGKNKYDFIRVEELAKQIVVAATQQKIDGIINCCTGVPLSLGEKVEMFIKENNFKIKPKYGAFPDRPYDSPEVWGDVTKIQKILEEFHK